MKTEKHYSLFSKTEALVTLAMAGWESEEARSHNGVYQRREAGRQV